MLAKAEDPTIIKRTRRQGCQIRDKARGLVPAYLQDIIRPNVDDLGLLGGPSQPIIGNHDSNRSTISSSRICSLQLGWHHLDREGDIIQIHRYGPRHFHDLGNPQR